MIADCALRWRIGHQPNLIDVEPAPAAIRVAARGLYSQSTTAHLIVYLASLASMSGDLGGHKMVVGQDMPFRRDREPCSPALQRYFGRQRAALAKMTCEFMPDHAHVELEVEDAIRVVAREVAKPVLGSIWPGLVTRSAPCLIGVVGPVEI